MANLQDVANYLLALAEPFGYLYYTTADEETRVWAYLHLRYLYDHFLHLSDELDLLLDCVVNAESIRQALLRYTGRFVANEQGLEGQRQRRPPCGGRGRSPPPPLA